MNNANTYKFENDGWGSLELEIADSNRSFYQPNNLDKMPFNAKGFGKSNLESIPFYFFEWQKIQYSYIIENTGSFIPPFELRINNRTVNKSKE